MIKLLGNRILVKPLKLAPKSPGGIFYVENYQDDRTQYEVLAVGPGKRNKRGEVIPPEVQVGDHIFAPLWRGNEYEFEDGRLIVDADQVQMVWRPPTPEPEPYCKPITTIRQA